MGSWLALVLASAAVAQSASLERVEELVRLGRTDEARGVLQEWWDGSSDAADRRELQRGLWLRGRLTVDPVQAELDFQRLVVLYPRGPFTAQAILRLAQAAYAMGDEARAREHVATLARDYPRSPVRTEAEDWLSGAGPAPPPPDPRVQEPRATERPVERPADTPPTRPAQSAAAGSYYVQLGAFAEEARALALYDEVRAAGVEVRVVRVEGSRFLHVRHGRFVERADAVAELERLADQGITGALVRDERPEQVVRGGA